MICSNESQRARPQRRSENPFVAENACRWGKNGLMQHSAARQIFFGNHRWLFMLEDPVRQLPRKVAIDNFQIRSLFEYRRHVGHHPLVGKPVGRIQEKEDIACRS